ncbi:hypothetical protein MSAN_00628000 [Mycena sanguinolenta]|uniref:Uncharacterized protein n=1 Tax=Mycena sanguinolenta TaxID=230812 RepID=A0A8H6Z503_9AGAR|nr:hypothetical protein MSAN_00628000 [Mycena sanguinolenta]
MSTLHRSSSDITHVSDSEPECNTSGLNGTQSKTRNPIPTRRPPFTTISNALKPPTLEKQLSVIGHELSEIKEEVRGMKSHFNQIAESLSVASVRV